MIRRSTVVYIVLLLGLIGAYFYLKNRAQPADIELTAEPSLEATQAYLFTADEGTPSSIRVESKAGQVVEVTRGAENAWAMTEPIEAKAEQGAAEAAATQVTTMRIVDTIPGNVDLELVGLQSPEYVLTVKFTSGVERTVDVGVITPTESGYYVRDPDGKVLVVSQSAVDALLGLLDNPPYAETPTPSPVPATEILTPLSRGTSPSGTATP
jgi:hypothetical protein